MRITFLSHFPGRGGSTSLMLQFIEFYKSRGHQTSVVVGKDSPDPQVDSYHVFQPTPGANWRRRLTEYRELVESTRPDVAYFVSGVEECDLLRFLRCARVRHTSAMEQHAVLDAPFWVKPMIPYWDAVSANTPDVFGLLHQLSPARYEELFAPYRLGDPFYSLRPNPQPVDGRPIEICCIGRLETNTKIK
jgi:hypothetical protein